MRPYARDRAEAMQSAKQIVALLPPGFKPRVSYNCGWFYSAVLRIKNGQTIEVGCTNTGRYCAAVTRDGFVSPVMSTGKAPLGYGKSPRAAVSNALSALREGVAHLSVLQEGVCARYDKALASEQTKRAAARRKKQAVKK